MRFLLKAAVFAAVFYALCAVTAFFVRNDADTYTRTLMHELHNQEGIDVLFCGASHVSHGLYPAVMDGRLGLRTFCTGTPFQSIEGTYAVLQEAASMYRLKRVFLECDFAVSCRGDRSYWEREPSKGTFLAAHYLKNPRVKIAYVLSSVPPRYWLNAVLPLGRESLLDLNPASVFNTARSKLSGEYWRYECRPVGAEYGGRGCVFDDDVVENGTFSSGYVEPLDLDKIGSGWKDTVDRIIAFCRENGIQLDFYSNPSTDFYLTEKRNYGQYVRFLKAFLAERGFRYYDFSLCRPEYLALEDCDFSDDNHLNRSGILKFTSVFCDFFSGAVAERDLFYDSWEEKLAAQPERIYGLMFTEGDGADTLFVTPVTNRCDPALITYDVSARADRGGAETALLSGAREPVIRCPANGSGVLTVTAYYGGERHCRVTRHFTSL